VAHDEPEGVQGEVVVHRCGVGGLAGVGELVTVEAPERAAITLVVGAFAESRKATWSSPLTSTFT
jgi:hypothetical protein